jgi:hypothetical protein
MDFTEAKHLPDSTATPISGMSLFHFIAADLVHYTIVSETGNFRDCGWEPTCCETDDKLGNLRLQQS